MELDLADIPSMKNMYSSTYMDNVKNDEYKRAKKMYKDAQNPMITGVVPQPGFSSLFDIEQGQNMAESGEYISALSGLKMTTKDLQHNNMKPFLRGGITQNTNIERFTSKLDRDTGVDKYYMKKKEAASLFKPIIGLHNVNGAKPSSEFYKSRLETPRVMNNVSPIPKVYVGPGLNKGYSSLGSGGYQQSDTLDYARPKTLDNLRSKVNQKQSVFDIPFQAPIKGTDQRGVTTPFAKNKPERTYAQTEENWFKTTGANTKDSVRPELVLKEPTKADMHVDYTGSAKLENVKGVSDADDYGKRNIIIYSNERDKSQTCTTVANLTTNVKAMLIPVVDALRLSLKEYLVDAPRAGGNPLAQIPNKPTVHDPADVPKTTVKETIVQDSDTLNLTGPNQTYSALQDEAKTTVKETLIHDGDLLNVKSNSCSYMKNDDDAKTTIRETLPVVDTKRNIGAAVYKVYVYDPDTVAKTTVKQTTIKGKSELGFIGGLVTGLFGGYESANIELKNTHKQFTSDNDQYGIAKSVYEHVPMSREAEENAETNGAREQLLIDAGHTPNPGNMNIGIDKSDIYMESNRLLSDDMPAREAGNMDKVYQTHPVISELSITREPTKITIVEDRLDNSILESLKYNDLSIKINPI